MDWKYARHTNPSFSVQGRTATLAGNLRGQCRFELWIQQLVGGVLKGILVHWRMAEAPPCGQLTKSSQVAPRPHGCFSDQLSRWRPGASANCHLCYP